MTQTLNEKRKNAAGYLAAGGAITGVAAGANSIVDSKWDKQGQEKIFRAAANRRLTPRHAKWAAGKVGVYATRMTGIPLMAYGGYNMVKPKSERYVRQLDVKRDVINPVVGHLTLKQEADKAGVRKRDARPLTAAEQKKLIRRKKAGRHLSEIGGTLGLSALALRTPELAGMAIRRVPKLAHAKPLAALATKEPLVTRASNTLGIAAIGSGSVGSFNYASQQKLEQAQQEAMKKAFREPAVVKADRWLAQHGQSISPSAEEGYKTLKRARNRETGMTAGNAVLGGVVAADAVRRVAQRAPKLGAAVMGTWAGVQGMQTAYNAQNARSLQRRLNKIKAKGYEREAEGKLGPNREPVDKAGLLRVPRINYTRRIGAGLANNRPRSGGVRRNAYGTISTFRGSVK